MLPRIVKNFKAYVNGIGYAGLVDEAKLPEVVIKMEEHRAGGMDGVSEIDMGTEAMSMSMTFSEFNSDIIKGIASGRRIQLRGAMVRDSDNTTVPVVIEVAARQKKFSPGSLKAGEKTASEHEYAVDYFRWTQGGEDLIEIDVENMIRKIGGVDQMAAIRAALG